MRRFPFYIVDVFAEEKYAGNQLAVVRNARTLTSTEMQKIAKEMNYSETTFILSDKKRKGGYDVRIFTPAKEVPFAGHPTLGTAYIIQQEIIKRPVQDLVLNLKVGQIPVTFSYANKRPEVLFMRQLLPTFSKTFDAATLSQVLNIEVDEIDERFPIQEVSTGISFIIVPLRKLDTIKRVKISKEKYFDMIKTTSAKAILVFSPETYGKENDLNVRVFAEYYGVPEDPATGSANGCLAGYLARHRYFGKRKIDVRVEQGYEIGRQSLLLLKATAEKDRIDVLVGGKAIMVAKGELV